MKVHNQGDIRPVPMPAERGFAEPTEKVEQFFGVELEKNIDEDYRERLGKLLNKITEEGDKLSQNPTYSELRVYRNLVRDFIGEAVNRCYLMESKMGWDNRGRQKMYSTIKKVDVELAALTEDVRLGQERQLSIMERLGTIKGLLLDMYI